MSDNTEWKPTAATPEPAPAPPTPAPPTPTPVTPTPVSPAAPDGGAGLQPGPAAAAAGAGERLSIDEFMRVELRVAQVLTAERVPKSKKLMKLWIDLGYEQRTIVAGIAEAYEPEGLVGRKIVIVANLKPAKLMGIESNGMVLAASSEDGKPMLLAVDPDAQPGMRVR